MKSLLVLAVGLLLASSQISSSAPGAPEQPFNGKNLDHWKLKGSADKSHWTVGSAIIDPEDSKKLRVSRSGNELVNAGQHGVDISTEAKYGDATIEVEVMIPKNSNSGIYLMGEYEIQVADSHGKAKMGGGDMGAIYSAAPAAVNASKPAGEWQKYVIEFRAPRFDAAGKKVANAKFTRVQLNGQTIHQDVEVKGPTPGGLTGKEAATGPLMFQGDHGPVAYRNIKISSP